MTDGSTAAPTPGKWQTARVVAVRAETSTAKTFRLQLTEPAVHLAGQHYLLRLTAPDGYQATRSYSVASPPDGTSQFELTVERLPDGEVSGYLHDVVVPGDELEVRGPVGGWFVWRGTTPALLVGGGSGIVPLMAMLRFARKQQRSDLVQLVVSVRNPEELLYRDELAGPESHIVYTRAAPMGSARLPSRINASDIAARVPAGGLCYVCGSPGFADTVTALLTDAGVASSDIRVERFGPTG